MKEVAGECGGHRTEVCLPFLEVFITKAMHTRRRDTLRNIQGTAAKAGKAQPPGDQGINPVYGSLRNVLKET